MTPKQLVSRLEIVVGIDGSPRRLKEVIRVELATTGGFSPLAAATRTEKAVSLVARQIERNAEASSEAGMLYPLAIIGNFADVVVGSCFHLAEDTPEVKQLKSQRSQTALLLTHVQQLTPAQFETFGARVLAELGAQHTKVTPHANDQGVDFYGELSLGKAQERPPAFFRLAHDVKIAFAGQAKHYPTSSIGPDIVRELVGAISLARTKTFSKANIDLFETVDIKPFTPLLALLLTTGKLSTGAVQLAKEAGVIARDGHQLAVFLADKGVGMEATPGGPVFRTELFMEWLTKKATP